ncbi:MAG: sulfide/dihydroorotate dehydrogenase-like FAD/NAD-binding protein [Clostridia bacterium]
MFEITYKRKLNGEVTMIRVHAPLIARKARPGQFVMVRVDETGERIPLTIADKDPGSGEVTVIFQEVGNTTIKLGKLEAGEHVLDFTGPLGTPTETEGYRDACVIGGGLGTAIAYPQARGLKEAGARVDVITGFRNKDLVFLEKEMEAVSDRLIVTTDDGSNGRKGFVTDVLKELLKEKTYDLVVAIGPLPMMKAVAELTRGLGIKTIVSMNPVMVDGTGMCGGCRVTVGGKVKFACVDGPDFDGHLVDFDEAMRRQKMYVKQEHRCRLDDK